MNPDGAMYVIYGITNTVNGKIYVGHTGKFRRRIALHRFHLARGTHHSPNLQNAWKKYGADAFEFEVLQTASDHRGAISIEQFYIDACRCAERLFGYNVCPIAGGTSGYKHSEATREKISRSQRGRSVPLERRQRIAEALRGKTRSREAVQKQREKVAGRFVLVETRQKQRASAVLRNGSVAVTAFGRTQHINDWAREYGINAATLRNRVYRSGLTLEEALLAPPHRGRRRDLEN